MTQVQTSGRHRAARRPSTPLDVIGSSIATSLSGNVGRGAVVAFASSGLVFGVSTAASAEPDTIKAPSLKTVSLTADQITRSAVQETITVEAGSEFSFSTASLSAIAPPPPPPPPVVRTVTASRTRTAIPATTTRTTTANEATAEAEAPAEAAPAPAIDGDAAAAVISIARKYIGVPYVSGGASPSGFDCSGFTQYVFAQIGVSLPRTSSAQRNAGYVVSASEARAGDLIWAPGHVGIYLGNGQHIAARNYSTPLSEGPVYMSNPTYIRVLG